jgi:hypothetical protein
MQNPISYLKQAYPINNNWRVQLRTAFAVGLFIAIFLIVFQPFGISRVQSEIKLWVFFGYGLVTFLILLFDLILIKKLIPTVFEEESWTIWKQLFFSCWIIFSIGLGNSAYTILFFKFETNGWDLLFQFQFITLAIGIIPILAFTMINQNQALKKNLLEANQLNSGTTRMKDAEDETIYIVAENGKDNFSGLLSELLFITSEGNYIRIYHTSNCQLKKTILRNTLTNTEQQLSSIPTLLKTHRAFLVNLEKIKQVQGNSQGLRLQFDDTKTEVPVSRSYLPDFKMAWQRAQD